MRISGWSSDVCSAELTAHGAPTRLRLHLAGGRDIAIPVYVASGRQVRIPGFLDGPIVRRGTDGNWSATWFCEDRPHRSTLPASALSLHVDCAGTRPAFPLSSPHLARRALGRARVCHHV